MAKLEAPVGRVSGLDIQQIAPAGQYIGVRLKVIDLFDVERKKFQSEEMEKTDMTRFVFGIVDQQGHQYLLQTFEYKISGANNSNLFKFLTAWLGRPPEMGWDYCEMEGQGAMITTMVEVSSQQRQYSKIVGIAPVFGQLASSVPPKESFAGLLQQAEAATQQAAQQRMAEQNQQAAPAATTAANPPYSAPAAAAAPAPAVPANPAPATPPPAAPPPPAQFSGAPVSTAADEDVPF